MRRIHTYLYKYFNAFLFTYLHTLKHTYMHTLKHTLRHGSRAIAVPVLAFAALMLQGCAVIPLLAGSSGAAGRGEASGAPIVNSAIYSSDYVVDEGPVKGGSIRIYATYPDTFNPLLTRNVYTSAMLGLVYESLVAIGPDLAPLPRLAERWTVSVDGLIWHIVLQEGIDWHDGRPLKAQDVVYTIDNIRSYGAISPYSEAISNIVSVTAMSDREIRMVLKKENAFAPMTWTFPIVPSHVMVDALDGLSGGANLGAALIGTGPYSFRTYVNGDRLILTEAGSWKRASEGASAAAAGASIGASPSGSASAGTGTGANAGANVAGSGAAAGTDGQAGGAASQPEDIVPPYIKDVSFIFHEPAVMALPLFRNRDIDIFFSKSLNYQRYKSSSELRIRQYSERDFLFVAFNCSSGISASKNVRRALLRMLDRQRAIDEALEGRGIAAEFPVQPENSLYATGIVHTPYDPQSARSILESAGFRMDDGTFYGDAGNGWRKLSLTLLVNDSDAERCGLAENLSLMFAESGVEIIVAREPADEIMQKVASGSFEMALLDYRSPLYPDMTELYSTPWQDDKGGMNPAGYQNDEVDRLSHALFNVYDESDRLTVFSEMTAIIQDDAPYMGICFRASVFVHGDGLKGDVYPCAWNPLNFFERWYLSDYK